jgi:hypothetical protein
LSAEALLARVTETAGPRAVVLVLMGIANHDNLGGIFRNAAAFGVDGVILDGDCCDPFYRKAIRVSIGATLSVPTAWLAPGEDVVDLLARHGFQGPGPEPGRRRDPGAARSAGPGGGAVGGGGAGPVPVGHGARADHRHPDGGRLRLLERGHHQRDRAAPPAVRGRMSSRVAG